MLESKTVSFVKLSDLLPEFKIDPNSTEDVSDWIYKMCANWSYGDSDYVLVSNDIFFTEFLIHMSDFCPDNKSMVDYDKEIKIKYNELVGDNYICLDT